MSDNGYEKIGDPYINGERKKVSDFFKGFLNSIGLIILFTPIVLVVWYIGFFWGFLPLAIIVIIYICVLILLSLNFLKKNRRFIAIGMMIPFLIGLIIVIIALTINIISSIVKLIAGVSLYSFFYTWVFVDIGLICLFLVILFLFKKYSKKQRFL